MKSSQRDQLLLHHNKLLCGGVPVPALQILLPSSIVNDIIPLVTIVSQSNSRPDPHQWVSTAYQLVSTAYQLVSNA